MSYGDKRCTTEEICREERKKLSHKGNESRANASRVERAKGEKKGNRTYTIMRLPRPRKNESRKQELPVADRRIGEKESKALFIRYSSFAAFLSRLLFSPFIVVVISSSFSYIYARDSASPHVGVMKFRQ